MCSTPCLLPLHLCLPPPSVTYRLMHILSFFQTHSTAPLTNTVAQALDQMHTEVHWAIFVCSLQGFFACVIFPYISGLKAGGVIASDAARSGEALRFCLCVMARLDADQSRILANLWGLTQCSSEFLVFLKSLEAKAEHSGWIAATMRR